MRSLSSHKQQLGQSMTEYMVVLAFGVMVITTGPGGDMSLQLLNVMKNNYEGYSYGMSLSEAPDYDDEPTYEAALIAAGYAQEDIDRLAVNSVDVFSDLSPYNRDPLRQLNAAQTTLQNCMNAVPQIISSAGNLITGSAPSINCP